MLIHQRAVMSFRTETRRVALTGIFADSVRMLHSPTCTCHNGDKGDKEGRWGGGGGGLS